MINETTTTSIEERLRTILGEPWGALTSRVTLDMPLGDHRSVDRYIDATSALTFGDDSGGEPVTVATTRLVIIEVDDLEEDLWDIHAICDELSGDLETVAGRLIELVEREAVFEGYCNRLVILDAVEVTAEFRGMGAGQLAAATALHGVGALGLNTLTAAIAGARTSDDTERAAIVQAAAGVLAGVGFTRFRTRYGDLLLGDPNLASFQYPLRQRLARR